MRQIEFTHSYLKDLRLARKKHLPEEELNFVIAQLASDKTLEERYRDHPLKGNYVGFRECHIKPDWLLIYKKENLEQDFKTVKMLYLMRTGSHAYLFE